MTDVKLDKLIEDLALLLKHEDRSPHGTFPVHRDKLKVIIAALERLLPIDAGTHVIVPVEPTDWMIAAAQEFLSNGKWDISDNSFFGGMYRAMIKEQNK